MRGRDRLWLYQLKLQFKIFPLLAVYFTTLILFSQFHHVWWVSDLNPTKMFSGTFPFKAVRNVGGAQCEGRKQAVVWEHDYP